MSQMNPSERAQEIIDSANPKLFEDSEIMFYESTLGDGSLISAILDRIITATLTRNVTVCSHNPHILAIFEGIRRISGKAEDSLEACHIRRSLIDQIDLAFAEIRPELSPHKKAYFRLRAESILEAQIVSESDSPIISSSPPFTITRIITLGGRRT